MNIDIPELLAAERLVTRPLRAHRGWVVRVRVAGKWVDHPQVRWPDALAAVRKLEDFEDAVLWAGEMAEKRGASWKKAARQVIDYLPKIEFWVKINS